MGVRGCGIKSSMHKKLPATYLLFSSTSAPVGDVLLPAGERPNFKRLNKPYRLPALQQPEIRTGVGGVKEARVENGRTKKREMEKRRRRRVNGKKENWQKGNGGDGNLVGKKGKVTEEQKTDLERKDKWRRGKVVGKG